MSFFDLDPTATANVMDQAVLHPLNPEDIKPGWFAGTWKAPVTGLATTLNDVALLAGDAGTPVLQGAVRPIDKLFGTKLEDYLAKEQQKNVSNITDWAPDPRTTGVVGQAIHGFFNIGSEAVLGGPETAAVLQGYKGYRQGMVDGLDPGTALGKGAIDGISAWVGLKIPMSVAPMLGAVGAVGTGAAGNLVTGMATRGATAELLRARGYPDMAEQYKVMDQSAIAADLILGGGFGALAHYGPAGYAKFKEWQAKNDGKLMTSDRDTALFLNNVLHTELDTAPGIPADPAARAAHVEALTKTIDDLLAGRDFNVSDDVTRANFEENPSATETRQQIASAIEDHMGPEWQSLKIELESRGLTTEDIDTTPVVKMLDVTPAKPAAAAPAAKAAEPAIPTLQEFAASFKPAETAANPFQAQRDFEAKQQTLLLGEVSKVLNGKGGLTLQALRDLGLVSTMKDAMRMGLGRLVKSKDRGGMGLDELAERLHQAGWTPDESITATSELMANVFAKKDQREPVVHSSMQEEYNQIRKAAADAADFEAYTSEQAASRARMLGSDEAFATANPEVAHAYFDQYEKDLARQHFETTGVGKLDPQTASIVIDNPGLEIAGTDGSMSAVDALVKADAEIAKAEQDSQGFDAAASCALRG